MDWMKTPPLYALKAFESAARHQSFTHAACELSITQSAISKHIHTVEDFFGKKLFERNGPRIFLTSDGEQLAKELQYAFVILCRACENFHYNEKVLRIHSPAAFALRWIIPVLRLLGKKSMLPLVTIENKRDDYYSSILDMQGYDGMILYGDGLFPNDWNSTLLISECITPVISPDLLHSLGNGIPLAIDLIYTKSKEIDWLLWRKEYDLQDKVKIINRYEFESMDSAIAAAVQGLGMAIVDINLVKKELENNTLVMPFKCAVYSGKGYYFVSRDNRKDSVLSSFLERLKGYVVEQRVEGVKYINRELS
ncbi:MULTISPECIES: LysR family transcriptional regulator [unclassified Brenneria]|uniref:LysR family transcriptional regulator n=1 Tax=unclassified Brenneria TaxID=2634434 RepID=UPI00155612B1|nr:LysR family transcriptional regulator [Brenneria sp. hezel4-2-4]MEE3650601.1 LysR family transcriptional regulator [Brenneria sp. HEZEL_4_2_4]NPD00556.1 LysR family transcriptional regulator [Brenneria sp. hezel4-2-4]